MTARPPRRIAFVGPTLAPSERPEGSFTYLPPIRHGDLFALDLRPGDQVLVIDGVYQHFAPIRHKEILAVLALGVRVAGTASLGALRAAELAGFGMRGLGHVYTAARCGELVADADVGVLHAADGDGGRRLTVATVAVRHAVAELTAAGRLSAAEAARIRQVADSLHFTERSERALLHHAGPARPAMQRLVDHLADHGDVKTQDALAALHLLESERAAPTKDSGWGPAADPTREAAADAAARPAGGRRPEAVLHTASDPGRAPAAEQPPEAGSAAGTVTGLCAGIGRAAATATGSTGGSAPGPELAAGVPAAGAVWESSYGSEWAFERRPLRPGSAVGSRHALACLQLFEADFPERHRAYARRMAAAAVSLPAGAASGALLGAAGFAPATRPDARLARPTAATAHWSAEDRLLTRTFRLRPGRLVYADLPPEALGGTGPAELEQWCLRLATPAGPPPVPPAHWHALLRRLWGAQHPHEYRLCALERGFRDEAEAARLAAAFNPALVALLTERAAA
ncbi:TfuA domain-containing protein (plasmid) [Streptomyces sp. NBC_01278]|uniref:TfuA-like protein n=1 Tax=Streptomyces sp. NBC_01278 TaxID=2903809 RepID=UPI002E302525|nr:TfuA-like protein [Streptomyces sp. NBC_01278]